MYEYVHHVHMYIYIILCVLIYRNKNTPTFIATDEADEVTHQPATASLERMTHLRHP